MHILVLNGPNLNLLGTRQVEIYGVRTYSDLVAQIQAHCDARGIYVEIFQTNHEGALVDAIQGAHGVFDGIVINAAAYTHTSIALLDALQAINIPAVEVHISNPDEREDFRHVSYLRTACLATMQGKGFAGYLEAIDLLAARVK